MIEKRTMAGVEQQIVQTGEPKMNKLGVQSIMAWLTLVLSPHTVQGNFKDDMYFRYIRYVHQKLALKHPARQ